MNVRSLLYISESLLPCDSSEMQIVGLVMRSRRYNLRRHITGALLYTGTYFAQVIEDPVEEVSVLAARIAIDQRHENYMVVQDVMLEARRFPRWSLAYAGPSLYVTGMVVGALQAAPGSGSTAAVLIRWMQECALED